MDPAQSTSSAPGWLPDDDEHAQELSAETVSLREFGIEIDRPLYFLMRPREIPVVTPIGGCE
jgi:hypothetical protein